MIYDCFLFYNELDLLEIRLNELDSVVGRFVLVEATVTHTNKPKPLYFKENKQRFKKFLHKITHIIVNDSPDVDLPWIIERYQLEATTRGLKECKPNDIILYGAVDEIPKAEKILESIRKPGRNKAFLQKLCKYFLNYTACDVKDWQGTNMIFYKNLRFYISIYFLRYSKKDFLIEGGGWHFSYMGGIKSIQKKLASTTHQEFNNSRYNTPEHIRKSILKGEDFLDTNLKFKVMKNEFLPQYAQENKKKFSHLLIDNDNLSQNKMIFLMTYLNIKQALRVFTRKFLNDKKN